MSSSAFGKGYEHETEGKYSPPEDTVAETLSSDAHDHYDQQREEYGDGRAAAQEDAKRD